MDNYTRKVVDADGTITYFKDKVQHRTDGPAIERNNGEVWYFEEGKVHRIGGPAITGRPGLETYYINGLKYTKDSYNLHPQVVEHRRKTLIKQFINE